MSQLLTKQAIEQAGTLITHKGNTEVPGASTLGVNGGTNGCLITFDQSNGQIAIGDNSNNAYLQLFTTSGDTAIRDSANANLLAFTADSSPVNYANIKNAATGNGPELSCIGADSNISLEVIPKGTGTLHLKGASAPSTGIDFSAGSSGTNSYILKGPQDGAQSSATASITLPTFTSAPTTGHVLKVAASTSGTAVVTEWAADSTGASLTWTVNTTTSGTNTESPSSANVALAFAGTFTSGTRAVDLSGLSTPSAGDRILVSDSSGQGSAFNIAVTGQTINGTSGYTIDSAYEVLEIAYINASVGWTII